MWGGSLQHHLHEGPDAYHGEIAAQMMALKWVHDLFRTVGRLWSASPAVHFCFDSDSAAGCVWTLLQSRSSMSESSGIDAHWPHSVHCLLHQHRSPGI